MTTPDHQPSAPGPSEPEHRDRVYRSQSGIAGGVLMLAIVLWLGIDAIVAGHGRTPWLALALLILVIPAVTAFTLRPAVYANDERLRIRNPFRVIVLPWDSVAALRSGYSNEAVSAAGTKYQMWALPVSLRARKRANTRVARRAAGQAADIDSGLTSRRSMLGGARHDTDGPLRSPGDQIMHDLRELAESHEHSEHTQGEPTVRWAYEVIGPVVAGAVLLAILLATG
ncbi:PH domain-containing protein [Streptomyces sp. NPDC047022]|uniref:PH domain-containing protein n=1 Tax=Streptomyces sp. NPDC047022 TaxID=3155737 RepID=UPI00340B0386